MSKNFVNLFVFGMNLENVEEVAGGWQLYLRASESEVLRVAENLAEEYVDDEEFSAMILDSSPEDIDATILWDIDEYRYPEDNADDYTSNCHCDTYGICGGFGCSNYFRCHA